MNYAFIKMHTCQILSCEFFKPNLKVWHMQAYDTEILHRIHTPMSILLISCLQTI